MRATLTKCYPRCPERAPAMTKPPPSGRTNDAPTGRCFRIEPIGAPTRAFQLPAQAAAQVLGPRMPDGLMLLRFCSSTTAVFVAGP